MTEQQREIERRKYSHYSERIQYDFEKGEFYISRTFAGEEGELKLPLSTWNLVKTVSVYAVLVREVQNIDINQGVTKIIYYQQPITYTIEGRDSKEWFLRLEQIKDPDDRFKKVLCKVFLKNADTGQTNEAPLPNALFEPSSMPFLTVTKLKAVRIKKETLNTLLKDGNCLGIYNLEMINRII